MIAAGSSPPVRGALLNDAHELFGAGLIPARAGSTQARSAACERYWAHPRPCGEHREVGAVRLDELGSSPPVRGARAAGMRSRFAVGLIPARAGSTSRETLQYVQGWAHPRPCGEHLDD